MYFNDVIQTWQTLPIYLAYSIKGLQRPAVQAAMPGLRTCIAGFFLYTALKGSYILWHKI